MIDDVCELWYVVGEWFFFVLFEEEFCIGEVWVYDVFVVFDDFVWCFCFDV